jgi:hypothetical protein
MMDEAVGILYNDAHDRRVVISFADLQARMGPSSLSEYSSSQSPLILCKIKEKQVVKP